jgi:hypothetical protein
VWLGEVREVGSFPSFLVFLRSQRLTGTIFVGSYKIESKKYISGFLSSMHNPSRKSTSASAFDTNNTF